MGAIGYVRKEDCVIEPPKAGIPNRLRKIREELRYTRDDVVALTGIPLGTLKRQEQGALPLSVETVTVFCKTYRIKPYMIWLDPVTFKVPDRSTWPDMAPGDPEYTPEDEPNIA